ncbi:hypothetical protein ACQ5TV_05825 [Acetobacter ghanensis]|uniref:hypothetical protein n=1 Tax=Acetobacter ghanensis TaxID=431306 RepID=UPI003D330CEE
MTDPRIEAAVDAAWSHTAQFAGGETFDQYNKRKPYEGGAFRKSIVSALAAAEAMAWRHVNSPPQATEWVNIVSQQGGEVNYAAAQWDYTKHCWWNPELGLRYSPVYFTHWMPLPALPNTEASPAPETITIPEVRNDRPIPVKGESHS